MKFALKVASLQIQWNIDLILWHAEPLLGNDREISSYTTEVAK
jgi:hypothetical protein